MPAFPSLDFTKLDLGTFDLPKFDLPRIDVSNLPKIDLSKIDLSKIDLPRIDATAIDTERVKVVARDAAYVAIGLGVLTVQQAQVRRRELAGAVERQVRQLVDTLR